MQAYHDEEWGVPQHDPRMLWEMLMLEGFQAGLAWIIILRKRDAFRKAFAGFDPKKVARFGKTDVKRLMNCQLEINGGPMMVMDAMPDHGFPFQPSNSFTLQLIVDDGQAWFDRAVAAGCTVVSPFQQMFWGDKWGGVIDPFQIHWGIDEPAKQG